MVIPEACPACGAKWYQKNGHTRHGQQPHPWKIRVRPCGAPTEDHLSAEAQRTRMEHLGRERLSLRGLCRAVGVSLPWLSHLMVAGFAACPAA
jgi:hypothetical protein